jgi:hypothetical protein
MLYNQAIYGTFGLQDNRRQFQPGARGAAGDRRLLPVRAELCIIERQGQRPAAPALHDNSGAGRQPAAYQRLRPSSIVGIDGQDLYFVLDKLLPLDEILRFKIRRLVETGEFHYPVAKFMTQLKL